MAGGRVAVAYQDDPLRVVVERLAGPGVRRLVVVDRATRRVQGLVSLSDVAAYLFL
jgi:CBS domain-containing protein